MSEMTRYFHLAKVLETAGELEKKGYSVKTDYKVKNGLVFDIYASNPNKKDLYIEVKSGKFVDKEQQQIIKMSEYVKDLGNAKFELLVASPPLKKEIEIEGLGQTLGKYLNENLPGVFKSPYYRAAIECVTDLELTSIFITLKGTKVSGTGSVEATIYYKEEEKEDIIDYFPCKFTLYLDNKLKIQKIDSLEIDNSAYSVE